MDDPLVVIVGAGAAGIGAGLELLERQIPFVILEAAHRVGGRAFTDTASLPVPWDQGCHWLHCADVNPLVPIADRLGAVILRDDKAFEFAMWKSGRFLSESKLAEAYEARMAAFDAIDTCADKGLDVPITDVLPDSGEWNPVVRYILQAMGGDDPERISTLGYADYEDTNKDWPVISGYGDLIGKMSASLEIKLGIVVNRIRQGVNSVTIDTNDGSLRATAAIVTSSTNVLASGCIDFDAGPARDALEGIAQIPCGDYEKVAFGLNCLPDDVKGKQFCMIEPDNAAAVDFQVMDTEPPLMIAHMAGSLVREVSREGEAALISSAKSYLVQAFGSRFPDGIVATAATGWSANPFIQGSYSHALPGTAEQRWKLIEADTGNVAFAGEAFSRKWQATAHGAYQSGRDVAARIAQRIVKQAPN